MPVIEPAPGKVSDPNRVGYRLQEGVIYTYQQDLLPGFISFRQTQNNCVYFYPNRNYSEQEVKEALKLYPETKFTFEVSASPVAAGFIPVRVLADYHTKNRYSLAQFYQSTLIENFEKCR